ncbi:hypothetical protein QE152_g13283 [Popillia japonica]|uniref:Uncharacterized protein n=1 Tax=Popillia japonica TaxID=7064 RepID=A0AAW1LE18_POPJA
MKLNFIVLPLRCPHSFSKATILKNERTGPSLPVPLSDRHAINQGNTFAHLSAMKFSDMQMDPPRAWVEGYGTERKPANV